MRIIGLTGGIASGKSTVHRMLEELGAAVLDADAIYHDLLAPRGGVASPLGARIGEVFAGVLAPDGSVDRRRLAQVVFSDPQARRTLERLTHPAVAEETARRIDALAAQGQAQVVYDVPLLYERNLQGGMHGVIVVWVPRQLQKARLMARDGLDAAEAELRLAAQLPIDAKRRMAGWVIDNSGTLDATRAQVRGVWDAIVSV